MTNQTAAALSILLVDIPALLLTVWLILSRGKRKKKQMKQTILERLTARKARVDAKRRRDKPWGF